MASKNTIIIYMQKACWNLRHRSHKAESVQIHEAITLHNLTRDLHWGAIWRFKFCDVRSYLAVETNSKKFENRKRNQIHSNSF
jgi:hypothetical protein